MFQPDPLCRAPSCQAQRRRELRRLAGRYDAIVCSWEPFDLLARALPGKAILIAHNISSRVLPAILPGNPFAALAAARLRRWERRCYAGTDYAAVGALSRCDHAYLAGIGVSRPLLLPPGMPPCVPLADDAVLCRELVVSGTYDWFAKRRDVIRFAEEYAGVALRLPIRANGLPADASALLDPMPLPSAEDSRTAIRFGLIADRFSAGHKLKTLAYLADNQIVLSFADVEFDFAHLPDHAFFIRRVSSVAEIAEQVAAVAAEPAAALRERFRQFQDACAASFQWSRVATAVLHAAGAQPADPA